MKIPENLCGAGEGGCVRLKDHDDPHSWEVTGREAQGDSPDDEGDQ